MRSSSSLSTWLSKDPTPDKKLPVPVVLPNFHLFGKLELAELNEYKKLSRPIRNLLEKNYSVTKWAELRLTPEPNTHVIAAFSLDNNNKVSVGRAIVAHETENVTGIMHLSNKNAGKAGAQVRVGIPSDDRYVGLLVEGNSKLNKRLVSMPDNLKVGLAFKAAVPKKKGLLATELAYNIPKELVEGHLIMRYGALTAACNLKAGVRHLDAPEWEALFSYAGSNASSDDWRRPEFYDLSLRISENGDVVNASYYHQMKFHELWKKNQVHNVVLGGEFTHDAKDQNSLTVGGAWQLSRRALLKARMNTNGDYAATIGGTFGVSFPTITGAATVHNNAFKSGSFRFGVSFIMEDN